MTWLFHTAEVLGLEIDDYLCGEQVIEVEQNAFCEPAAPPMDRPVSFATDADMRRRDAVVRHRRKQYRDLMREVLAIQARNRPDPMHQAWLERAWFEDVP